MKLLIVAMAESVHTARWISQINNEGWDIHLFPSVDYGVVHSELKNVSVHHSLYGKQHDKHESVKTRGIPLGYNPAAYLGKMFLDKFTTGRRVEQLKKVIERVKPDIVHSLEIQHAGYMTLEAKKSVRSKFPPWIVTNWGSDIYLFGRLKEHEPRIREVLASCDYYSSECERDVTLARDFGFKGKTLPVFPNTGGFDLEEIAKMREKETSKRRVIMLKGYQHWAGRALVGLRALERAKDILDGYEIVIYSPSPEVRIAAELFEGSTGLKTTLIEPGTPHKEILSLHGRARLSIGLSISDAISTVLLEAIVMGSFPIQSWTSCGNEWVIDGETGLLVPPEDPEIIEEAIRRVISDDSLVERARERNYRMAAERLDQSVIAPKVVGIYRSILEGMDSE